MKYINKKKDIIFLLFLFKVIALLKSHNHQLCLSSKEYFELFHSNLKNSLSPHRRLYLDHSNKSSTKRPSSASPIRRPIITSTERSHSAFRRPQTSTLSKKQVHSRMKRLRQEFTILAREHTTLNTSRTNSRELEIINQRMEIILDELESLQKQLKFSLRKSFSKDRIELEKNETPLETLKKTKLLQGILKDPNNKQQHRERSHRTRPNSND
jgi:hypothetical protein